VQDALRRDLTINALFYNLDTCAIEDFSSQGLDDLRAGIIRTPLAPRETFMDGEQSDHMLFLMRGAGLSAVGWALPFGSSTP
jgi:Poly A polymerase head domain